MKYKTFEKKKTNLPTLIIITGRTREIAKINDAASKKTITINVSNGWSCITCLKKDRSCFSHKIKKMFSIGIFFIYTCKDRDIWLTVFQFGYWPPGCIWIISFITVLNKTKREWECNNRFVLTISMWHGRLYFSWKMYLYSIYKWMNEWISEKMVRATFSRHCYFRTKK